MKVCNLNNYFKQGGRMKIIHHVYNYYSYSGATMQAKKISKKLSESGCVINYYNSQTQKKSSFKPEIGVIDLPNNILLKFVFLLKDLIYNKYDIHHVHGFHFIEILVLFLLRRKFIFKCTLIGADDLKTIKESKYGFFKLHLLKKSLYINSLNPEIDKINRSVAPEFNYVIIPNAVDNEHVIDILIKEKNKFSICCGALVPRKNPIEVVEFFLKYYPIDHILYLIGPDDKSLPEFDFDYKLKLDEIINQNKERVKILGLIEYDELIAYYASADSMIFFSEREGTPNVILEAMSFNCPIVFKYDDIVTQWLVGNNYPQDLVVNKVEDYRYNGELLLGIKKSNYLKKQVNYFSVDYISKKTIDMYQQCL